MKKFGLIMCILCIMAGAFFCLRYGSLLKEADSSIRLLLAISILDITSKEQMEYGETEYVKRYVSINDEGSHGRLLKLLSDLGWTYKEQENTALYFHKGKETVVVESAEFNRDYVLWELPLEVFE